MKVESKLENVKFKMEEIDFERVQGILDDSEGLFIAGLKGDAIALFSNSFEPQDFACLFVRMMEKNVEIALYMSIILKGSRQGIKHFQDVFYEKKFEGEKRDSNK